MTIADEADPELALLRVDKFDITGAKANHGLKTAPIITGDALNITGPTIFPQKALYGSILETSIGTQVTSSELFINTNTPFSGIVCGVQGSGKSHSTSVLLESCLICDKRLGTLPEPLSAVLFHFDTSAGAREIQPCEAACIASLEGDATPPTVVVLVLPKYLTVMRGVYSRLPEVKVEPLHFAPEDLNEDRILAMMKVDQDQQMPLYVEYITSILQDMKPFSHNEFRRRLKKKFLGSQNAMLELRLNILDACLEGGNASNCVSNHFKKGQLTVIDLSSPFMDAASACGLFDTILQLFIQVRTMTFGKLVVLDKAHQYLTNSGTSSRLTDTLLYVIREQHHLGTRVLISTQEPTVVPSKFLELCSFVIAHRFFSQKWLVHLKDHIPIVDPRWASRIIDLETGEAIIFSPAALILRQDPRNASLDAASLGVAARLGQGYLVVRSRERITLDGGRSMMATEPSLYADRLPKSHGGSAFSSPKSVAEYVDSRSLSWKDQSDIDMERPCGSDFPASRSPSLRDDSELNDSVSLSQIQSSTTASKPSTSTNLPDLIQSTHNVEVQKPQTVTSGSSNSPSPVPNMGQEPALTPTPEIRFHSLLSILWKRANKGQYQIFFSELEERLTKLPHAPYGEIGMYVREAEQANMVEVGMLKDRQYVQLVDTGSQWCPESQYVPLVKAMRAFLQMGEDRPKRSAVAEMIYQTNPGIVRGRFKSYISGAKAVGVVVRRKKDRLQLVSH